MTVPERSLAFAELQEAELFVELLLKFYGHPLADDAAFRNDLLEKAFLMLENSIAGATLISDVLPTEFGLSHALWYSEFTALEDPDARCSPEFDGRVQWLDTIQAIQRHN